MDPEEGLFPDGGGNNILPKEMSELYDYVR